MTRPPLGERAEQALRMVREAPLIAYDTETSGLDWKLNHPVGYVVTVEKDSIYVPIRHAAGGNLLDSSCPPLSSPIGPFVGHDFEKSLAAAFRDRVSHGHTTVGHNLLFDCHFSANAGIHLGRNLEDTQLNEAMLDEFAPGGFSLDQCARRHKVTAKLGEALYAHIAATVGGPADRTSMGRFWELSGSDPLGVDYAEGDGVSTWEVREAQMLGIAEEKLDVIHRMESQLIWSIFRAERQGMKIDRDRLAEVKVLLADRLEIARQALPPEFNPRSPVQMRKLMEDNGHTNWPTTPIGNPSFTEKFLKGSETGRAVVTMRQLTNLSNSFIAPLEERHALTGRVHSSINQLKSDEYGTISGRFSSSNPNMQQVPKRNKDLGRLFRSIFIPDDGMDFVEADYSQCEPRLYAHYSQDKNLLEGYRATPFRDVHQVLADEMAVERDPTAKRMNMGIFTGMQPRTFAGHMEWPLDKATQAWNQWFETFPGVRDFQNTAKSVFAQRGYIRTLLGRRCRLDSARFAYRAASRIIQGGNADILKYKWLQCDLYLESEGDAAQFLMNCHDAFEWQSPQGAQGAKINAELIRICEDVQGEPFNLRVPFIMEHGMGPNWGVASYGPEH